MASFLRQIVAGPRLQHPEAGLDLCYVTDNIIATSGPSSTYPQRAYRNPLDALVTFLDSKHGQDWCIWEFRAEGTGYPDSEVYGRIHHYPWPDHHPPPFALIPAIMGSMRNWVYRLDDNNNKDGEGEEEGLKLKNQKRKRVAVVHCKAGKGRSGTIACSYLISHEGWKMEDALQRFTERRMRVGFGAGVSIPSQVRWVGYVDRWANGMGKKYVERPVEILEIHVWGLRDGVKVAVEGFVDEGKKIRCFHLFHRSERVVVDDGKMGFEVEERERKKEKKNKNGNGNGNSLKDRFSVITSPSPSPSSTSISTSTSTSSDPVTVTAPSEEPTTAATTTPPTRISAILLRPNKPIILPSSDVNIDFERRTKAAYTGWAMVTSVAHVWFNAYFEGGDKYDSGIFETDWECMDGVKGSTKKGIKALDRVKVVWRYPLPPSSQSEEIKMKMEMKKEEPGKEELGSGKVLTEPKPGDPVPEAHAANWRGQDPVDTGDDNNTTQDPESCLTRNQEQGGKENIHPVLLSSEETERNNNNMEPSHTHNNDHHTTTTTTTTTQEETGLTSGSQHPYLTGLTMTGASAASATARSLNLHRSRSGSDLGSNMKKNKMENGNGNGNGNAVQKPESQSESGSQSVDSTERNGG